MASFLFVINVIAALIFIIGYARIVIEAFSVGALWGLACIFFPGVAVLIFVALNWSATKTPFIGMAVGVAIFVGSMVAALSQVPATVTVTTQTGTSQQSR